MDARAFWEKFSFDYVFDTDRLYKDLVSIEAHRLAAVNLVLAPEWRAQLDKLNRVRAVHGTTALEGNPLSEAEVSHQMDLVEQEGGHATEATDERATADQECGKSAGLGQGTLCAWKFSGRAGRHTDRAQIGYRTLG